MRVLYFDSKFAPPRRSSPTRAYSFARHLVARGHEVTMVGRDPSYLGADSDGRPRRGRFVARERIDGIDVVWLNIPYRQSYAKTRRMASYGGFMVAAGIAGSALPRPDVVFASSAPLTIGASGLAAARVKRVPFVFEIQDRWPAVPVGLGVLTGRAEIAAAEWLEKTLYGGAERIVVCSPAQRAGVVDSGVPPAKTVLIPNVSDLELFRPGVVDQTFRARHGLEGKFVALYAGGMGLTSGVQQLAGAAAALKESGEDRVVLAAVGSGSKRAALERQVEERALDNLLVLPPVARDEIPGMIGAVDATMTLFAPFPVLNENSPNKFFDSLAAGKPAIVNLDGWLRGLVERHGAGVYVPAGDGPALGEALARLSREPRARLLEMGRNARALAEREFDRDLLAERLTQTLEDVAAASRGRKP